MEDKKETGKDLTEKQRQFCLLYVSKEFFANGVQSYAEAYNIDISEKSGYNTAAVNASKLLTNTNILEHIDSLLDMAGLTDQFVDKQLLFLITQKADMPTSISAIREYNKLKGRITEKKEVINHVEKIEIEVIKSKEVDE